MKKLLEAFGLALCAVLVLTVSIFALVVADPTLESNCPHENLVWKADSSEHWKECEDCGEEIPCSRKQHLLSYGHCDCEAYAIYEE